MPIEETADLYKLWDEFLAEWPENRIQTMTLDEYTGVGDQHTFCYWLEKRLETLGSIWGGSAFKFGVFRRKDQSDKTPLARYSYTPEFAWESNFGNSAEAAFETVKQHILTVIRSIKAKDLQSIESVPLWPVFKWKIAFLYQDRNAPLLPAVFKAEMLIDYLGTEQSSQSATYPSLYHWVMKAQNDADIVAFSRDIWTKAEQIATQKRFKPSDAEQILIERYLPIGAGTDKVIGFLNDSNRSIALLREAKTVRVIMQPWEPSVKGVKVKQRYGVNDSRNSNLNAQAPDLSEGNAAVEVECANRQAFETLLDEYDMVEMKETGEAEQNKPTQSTLISQPLNQILYGPPGTGKTYHTINKALEILDPVFLGKHQTDRPALHDRFSALQREGRIGFVTFHQSFAYEDFVEGIKASTEEGQIHYDVVDGIFKKMCEPFVPEVEKSSSARIDVRGRTVWKMSLGNTLGASSFVYDRCIEADEIRLGYGKDFDFSNCKSRAEVTAEFAKHEASLSPQDYKITAVDLFKNQMKVGDLVVVSDGNTMFRAIAEITGDYQYSPFPEFQIFPEFWHARKVTWLRVYEKSLPYERIMRKKFSQMTVYELSQKTIDVDKLQALVGDERSNEKTHDPANDNRVLIIDEINRGNISSIFGELITLIEPSKRAGADEALSVTLPYSKESFQVPNNLYIIGTMNTADRSLALMDTALRRRFDFVEMMPEVALLEGLVIHGIDVQAMLTTMNKRIEVLYDREHTLGHAFFMPLNEEPDEAKRFQLLQNIFANKVLPLLEEYFFEDWAKIRLVLGDDNKQAEHQFITENGNDYEVEKLFGKNAQLDYGLEDRKSYTRNALALTHSESYIGIYEG